MIKHNELVIDGVRTSSFPFKVIVHDSPSIALGESKTALLEHGGISGANCSDEQAQGTGQEILYDLLSQTD
ncbi:prophage LambdaSa04, tail protein [Streptococcus pneumoniae]|nr:prophage LambdaSa04, tail protein [Streptococcus pneumoniae]